MKRLENYWHLSKWEILGRALMFLLAAGFLLFPLWLMLHGQFFFYAAHRPGWLFVPPFMFFGAMLLYSAVRDYIATRKARIDAENDDAGETAVPEQASPKVDSK